MGNKIWSVTKTCPIYSQYDGAWYFYEDIAQLAPKWLHSEIAEQPVQGTPQTPAVSGQSKGEAFNQLYANMKGCLEQAYERNQQLQYFNWRSIEYLSWTSKDEKGNEQIMSMENVLPSNEALQPLLMQNEKCNAFAVKLWLEHPYEKPTDWNSKHLNPVAWYALIRQLEIEIGKAQDLANKVQLDASKKFADMDRELNIPGAMSRAYVREVQMKCADYKALLDDIIKNLEQSRLLAVEMRHLQVNSSALDVP